RHAQPGGERAASPGHRRLPVHAGAMTERARMRIVVPGSAAAALAGALFVPSLGGPSGRAQPASPTPSSVPSSLVQASPALRPAAAAGQVVYLRDCAWCHGNQGQGTDRGPSLIGVGAASADFMLSTGRMPIPKVEQQPRRAAPAYDPEQIGQIVSFVASLGPGLPIPRVDPAAGTLAEGEELYELNCAACHSSTGVGAALTSGLEAPTLLDSTARQIAEAVRLGGAGALTGKMPRFDRQTLSDRQVDSIIRYIQYLEHPRDRGGLPLGRVGPVAEGFVVWVGALVVLLLFVRWIGKRTVG